jgi:cytochrome c oxidase assembly protein subunit 15
VPALSRHNPGLHWFALFLAGATFPLIFIGGLVTSHGAGMAVPDWPNSYGYNMFLFPPSKWVGNIWYEHVHRLYASFIGLLSVGLCLWAWIGDRRPSVRWLATAVLVGVIVQGVLGGLRVVLIKLGLAIIHGCVAQAFFCLCALMAVVTSRWWADAPDLSQSRERPAGNRVVRLAVVAVVVVYCQLIVGAVMRHEQAGLAIPDLPLAYGKVLPPSGQNALLAAQLRVAGGDPLRLANPPFTLTQVWLAFGHRIGAVVVSLTLMFLVHKVLRLNRGRPSLLGPAIVLVGLLGAQLTLGVLTVLLRKPADVASTHVAVGALVLVMTFALAARAVRLYRPRPVSDNMTPRRGSQIGRDGFVPDHLLRTL